MIRLVISKTGTQTITEICDTCKCHIKNLTIEDIAVKGNSGLIIKNSKGDEITNTDPRPKCYCEHCND